MTGQNVTDIKHGEFEQITLYIQTAVILSKMDLDKIQVKARLHNKSQSWSGDIYSINEAENKTKQKTMNYYNRLRQCYNRKKHRAL